jgi:hypothetical protein
MIIEAIILGYAIYRSRNPSSWRIVCGGDDCVSCSDTFRPVDPDRLLRLAGLGLPGATS